jgi:hypothetical protein
LLCLSIFSLDLHIVSCSQGSHRDRGKEEEEEEEEANEVTEAEAGGGE